MDPSLRTFLIGAAGALTVELLKVYKIYQQGSRSPARYKRFGFYLVAAGLVAAGGGLAMFYHPTSDLLAFNLGLTAPLLLEQMTRPEPTLAEPTTGGRKVPGEEL